MSNARLPWLRIAVLALLAAPAFAQKTQDGLQGETIPYVLDSGKISNSDRGAPVVFEQTVTVLGAVWMRLHFSDATLRPGSYVRMTSLLDDEIQELDANGIVMWGYTSAYFNGHSVHLELIAAPGSTGNQIALDRVTAHLPHGGPCIIVDDGICNTDDRVPSSEPWAARLLPSNCTASIYNTKSCTVSAAHCVFGGSDTFVLEFNVPSSAGNCDIVHPPVADQFPVTGNEHLLVYDWLVMTVGSNDLGQTPYERYGEYRPLANAPASTTSFVEKWSYGFDNDDPTRSQTQQYSSGSILIRDEFHYRQNVDVMKGSSGSALIHNDEIIGVLSSATDCLSFTTRIDIPGFVAARETLCPTSCPASDFPVFAGCLGGPGQPLALECEPADLDGDDDVDIIDFGAFQIDVGCP